MNKYLYVLFIVIVKVLSVTNIEAQTGIISTIAGDGTQGNSGDGGAALSCEFYGPHGIALDGSGNLYIADDGNSCIRKLSTTGVITTFAGTNGTSGYSGDGGSAAAAQLSGPFDVAIDASGNVYIADPYYHVVRKVNTSGIISTFAGNGTSGYTGDGGPAGSAAIGSPFYLAFDPSGNLYISDVANYVVRKVNSSGIISTFAGNGTNGYTGDGGAATAAEISCSGVAADHSGNVYISDGSNNVIRKITTGGIISTFAGNGVFGYSGDGGPAIAAQLGSPLYMTFDGDGNMFFSEYSNYHVRIIDVLGNIYTFAGNGTSNYNGDGGPATSAGIGIPIGIAVDAADHVFIADDNYDVIRKITGWVAAVPNVVTESAEVVTFPNPSKGNFTIHILSSDMVHESTVIISNLLGQQLLEFRISSNKEVQIESGLPPGIYIITVTNNRNRYVTKMTIE